MLLDLKYFILKENFNFENRIAARIPKHMKCDIKWALCKAYSQAVRREMPG